jgi:hypothetical protein
MEHEWTTNEFIKCSYSYAKVWLMVSVERESAVTQIGQEFWTESIEEASPAVHRHDGCENESETQRAKYGLHGLAV